MGHVYPPRRPRRPGRYQVQVSAPGFVTHATIEDGICTAADIEIAPWIGCSAAWIYGRIRFEGWRGAIQALSEPEPVQATLGWGL